MLPLMKGRTRTCNLVVRCGYNRHTFAPPEARTPGATRSIQLSYPHQQQPRWQQQPEKVTPLLLTHSMGRLLLLKLRGKEVKPQPPLTNRFASGAVDRVKFLSRTSVGRCPTWRLPIVD